MTEGVRMDMRQIIRLAELVEPVGDAVGIHTVSVLLGKHVSAVYPSVIQDRPQPLLLGLVLFQQFHRFWSELERAAPAGLGGTFIDTTFGAVK